MRLGAEVVDLVGLYVAQQADQGDAVGQVRVVQHQGPVGLLRVLVDVVDPLGVEGRRAAHEAVHRVALGQQQFGQVRAVLPGDSGDEGGLAHVFPQLLVFCWTCLTVHS